MKENLQGVRKRGISVIAPSSTLRSSCSQEEDEPSSRPVAARLRPLQPLGNEHQAHSNPRLQDIQACHEPHHFVVALDLPLALLEVPIYALPCVGDSMRVFHPLTLHDVQCSGRDKIFVGSYETFASREVKSVGRIFSSTIKAKLSVKISCHDRRCMLMRSFFVQRATCVVRTQSSPEPIPFTVAPLKSSDFWSYFPPCLFKTFDFACKLPNEMYVKRRSVCCISILKWTSYDNEQNVLRPDPS